MAEVGHQKLSQMIDCQCDTSHSSLFQLREHYFHNRAVAYRNQRLRQADCIGSQSRSCSASQDNCSEFFLHAIASFKALTTILNCSSLIDGKNGSVSSRAPSASVRCNSVPAHL